MYTYEVISKNDKDTLETKIKKSGITSDFTLRQVYDHKATLEKDIKERKAKIDVCAATMQNIENNHKDVAKIIKTIKKGDNPTGVLATLFMWIREDMERDNQNRMLKERKQVVREYERELSVIHSTLAIPEPIKISYNKAK
jgi:hypothetical protein